MTAPAPTPTELAAAEVRALFPLWLSALNRSGAARQTDTVASWERKGVYFQHGGMQDTISAEFARFLRDSGYTGPRASLEFGALRDFPLGGSYIHVVILPCPRARARLMSELAGFNPD